VENFASLAEHHELQLDPSKLEMLLALVQSNEHGHVCYQELIELVRRTHKETHIEKQSCVTVYIISMHSFGVTYKLRSALFSELPYHIKNCKSLLHSPRLHFINQ